jgi:hypothetical protein
VTVEAGPLDAILNLGVSVEARREVDGGRALVLVEAKALGNGEQVVVGLVNGALEDTSVTVLSSRLTGGDTNNVIPRHIKVGNGGRKDIGDVKVKVKHERDTLTTGQIGGILSTNRHQLDGRGIGITITISITTDTKAIDTDKETITHIIVLEVHALDIPTGDGDALVSGVRALGEGSRRVILTLRKLSGNTDIREDQGISRGVVVLLKGDRVSDEEDTIVVRPSRNRVNRTI